MLQDPAKDAFNVSTTVHNLYPAECHQYPVTRPGGRSEPAVGPASTASTEESWMTRKIRIRTTTSRFVLLVLGGA
jgi:hypothetical protein